jgi:hypothetical protein
LAAETAVAEYHGVSTSYYERWLQTLEKLAIARGLLTPAELDARTTEYACDVHDEHAATNITAPTSLPGMR